MGRTAQARVVSVSDGVARVTVRRGYKVERLDRAPAGLRVGDLVTVTRITNLPFPRFVSLLQMVR